ncbi:MAG TPA: hypothetical protein VGL23_22170 [Chloroflexota bacterium]|jgi:hypothetical protein
MASLASTARSSAWAGLLAEQPEIAPRPVETGLSRARADCRLARAGIAASLAGGDDGRPVPVRLREWLTCVDELLATAERLHAHVEALPAV